MVQLELLNEENEKYLLEIQKGDVPGHYVEDVKDTIAVTKWGTENHLRGCCFAIKYNDTYVGIVLVGEAIEEDVDPEEVKGKVYFRILGFVIDERYRGQGIGSRALRQAMDITRKKYGEVIFLLECNRDNVDGIRFYEKMGFRNTNIINEEDDDYYLIKE